jgi:hyperosmotically inducible protein
MRRLAWLVALILLAGLPACREEGAAEKAGRKLDEAIDSITNPNEGTLEKLGRKADEAIEDAKEAIEELGEEG